MTIPFLDPEYDETLEQLVPEDVEYEEEAEAEDELPGAVEPYVAASSGVTT